MSFFPWLIINGHSHAWSKMAGNGISHFQVFSQGEIFRYSNLPRVASLV